MAGTWVWRADLKQYISPSGRKLTPQATAKLRNNFAAARSDIARSLAADLLSGVLTRAEFAAAFNVFIGDTITASFLAGRGGVNAMVDSDLIKILNLITDQLGFADAFTAELEGLSPDQVANQASLYGDAAVKAYEEGLAVSHGVELPGYPGDWVSECKAGDRCYWEITTTSDGETTYRWITVGDDKVCPTCARRGREWNPWEPGE